MSETEAPRIEFSPHALLKIDVLRAHGVAVTKDMVEEVVRYPSRVDAGCKGRRVAQGSLDETHVLRVVYELSQGMIRIITVYPGRRVRYEKNPI